MSRVMNRSFFLTASLFLFLLLCMMATTVFADTHKKQRVFDEANIFSAQEIEQLEAEAQAYSVKQKTDFIIVTLRENYSNSALKDHLGNFYEEEKLGFDRGHGSASLLGIDVGSREVYIDNYYRASEYLDNYRTDLVLDDMMDDLKNDNFYEASKQFLVSANEYMKYVTWVKPNNLFLKSYVQLIIALIIAGLVVWRMVYTSGGKVTTNLQTYLNPKTTRVRRRKDRYIRTTVTRRRKPSSRSSGGGGGRSSGGGGGRPRSGGGRSF